MNTVKEYLYKLRQAVFHRGETLALEGGISFGPGRDPKGSFYNHPKLGIYWYQPESAVLMDETEPERGHLKRMLTKLRHFRKTA